MDVRILPCRCRFLRTPGSRFPAARPAHPDSALRAPSFFAWRFFSSSSESLPTLPSSPSASGNYRQGTWPDLLWTLTLLSPHRHRRYLGRRRAACRRLSSPVARGFQLLAQFSPLLIPAMVFPLVLQDRPGAVLVVRSAGADLLCRRQWPLVRCPEPVASSSRELQKNLSLLQGITEGTTDSIFVKDLQAAI